MLNYNMKLQTFSEYRINESNNFIDLRVNKTDIYSTIYSKNNLILYPGENIYTQDIENKTGIELESGYSVLVVNPKKKSITASSFKWNADILNKTYITAKHIIDPTITSKIIKELISKNIIDKTYKYVDEIGNKTAINDTILNLSKLKDSDIIMYHGTTKSRVNNILKKGLRPIDTKTLGGNSMFRNNNSTIEGYTENNVYLTPSIHTAKRYALIQANNTDEPAIIKIKIPDPAKLLFDDDITQQILYDKILISLKSISKNAISIEPKKFKALQQSSIKYIKTLKSDYEVMFVHEINMNQCVLPNMCNTLIVYYQDYIAGFIRVNLINSIQDKPIYTHFKITNKLPDFANAICDYYNSSELDEFQNWLIDNLKTEYPLLMTKYWKQSAYASYNAVAYHGIIMPKFIEEVSIPK